MPEGSIRAQQQKGCAAPVALASIGFQLGSTCRRNTPHEPECRSGEAGSPERPTRCYRDLPGTAEQLIVRPGTLPATAVIWKEAMVSNAIE